MVRAGGLVAMPTETVYGLAADACSDPAVAAIFASKGRPQFNPLIIHVADTKAAHALVDFDPLAERLAARLWPGPLTLVLPRRKGCGVSLLASAGLDTLAVRVPAHPTAQALLREAGIPLAAPSANRSGRISPTQVSHVRQEFGETLPILDGGACEVGLESTVVSTRGGMPVILRPGAITAEMIENLCGVPPTYAGQGSALQSPGMLASHYAPSIPVRLDAAFAQPDEALLAFGANVPQGAKTTLNLSEAADLKEAAANLFRYLRRLDETQHSAIAVMPVPQHGLGVAINDRLKRAAAER